MVTVASHHEKANEQEEGCLTINGYDEENAPLVFSLKYISSDDRWLIDKIHVVFVENDKYFAGSAKCPGEHTNDALLREKIENLIANKGGVTSIANKYLAHSGERMGLGNPQQASIEHRNAIIQVSYR